ncbi:MAG: RDD family protein [Pseudomonadota bacterium]
MKNKILNNIEKIAKQDSGLPAKRLVAKLVDIAIFIILITLFGIGGSILGLLFIFVSDSMLSGQSPGKRLFDLQVVNLKDNSKDCDIKKSIIRNIPLGIVAAILSFPVLGLLLFFTVGLGIFAVEIYLIFTNEQGRRAGDIFADTIVIAHVQDNN